MISDLHPCATCDRPLAKAGDDLCDDCGSFGEGPHEAERAIAHARGDADMLIRGYVLTDRNSILLQLPADNQWGFVLADDDQDWPGGFGIAQTWEVLADNDPRITAEARERLQWVLDDD